MFEKVTIETLSTEHVLEITVWDALFVAQPMGVIRLGPHPNGSKPWMDSHVCIYGVVKRKVVKYNYTLYGVVKYELLNIYHIWSC